MKKSRSFRIAFLYICLLLAVAPAVVSIAMADGHGKGKGYYGKKEFGREGQRGGKPDKGNETTGQIAAWSLGAANLTVALSVLVKGVRRFAPVSPELKDSLAAFNNTQKKYLMRFHYILNPLILGMAVLHYGLSRCRSTALPEWGLLIMGVIVTLGIILKFKLCPKSYVRSIYRTHTQPALLLILVSVLLIGHMIVD